MILRFPDSYFFSHSFIANTGYKSYSRKSSEEYQNSENVDEEDVYSFKFADDEYVNEMTS